MWKAVLVLFMTSNAHPISTMVGQFPEAFTDKAECQEFLARTREDIDGTIEVFTRYAEMDVKVLNHNLHCFEDTGGEPI